MKRLALALLLLGTACHRNELPIGIWLWRVDGEWTRPVRRPEIQIAPVTVLVFRPDHEYVELHCWVLERPDNTAYVATNSPRVTVVGEWQKSWSKVSVVRKSVATSARFGGSIAPYCAPTTYRIAENSVRGDASGKGQGLYAPVTRLVAPDFEYYVKEARNSPSRCSPSK
ncbi:MAG: hypothetical protein DMF59_17100 [Acidobacteria bacterium]|nr:MAG: hypothetical protein DMF59_17100 [Acidobacteriota bacterium]